MKGSIRPSGARRSGRTLRGCVRRFLRNEKGAFAVEFSLLAVPFLGLLLSTFEVAWVVFNTEQLQAAVDRAARQVMVGQAQGQYATASAFVSNLLCPTDGTRLLPMSMDCTKLILDVRTAADFSTVDATNAFYTGSLQYCLGKPSTIVVLRVVYPLGSLFPVNIYNRYIGLANNVPTASGWNHVLMGSAVFQTEPYPGNAPAC